MAIALYSTTNGATGNNVSVDASSGADRLIVATLCAGSLEDVTGITWNSEAFTNAVVLDTSAGHTSRYHSIWYLVPTGTGTQTTTFSGSLTDGMGLWTILVYTGVNTIKSFTSNTSAAATSFSLPITANDGDWIIAAGQSSGGTVSAGANTTIRSASSSIFHADSNGAASPTALAFTSASGTWGACGVAIAFNDLTQDPTETNSSSDSITLEIDTAYTDTVSSSDSQTSKYGFVNSSKSSTTWSNLSKL